MRRIFMWKQIWFNLTLIASVGVAIAVADQLVVQPVPRATPRGSTSRIIKHQSRLARTSQDSRDGIPGPVIAAPISGYVADGEHRGVRPIFGFRMFSFIGDPVDFGEDVASILSSPNQNYIAEVAATGILSLWVEGPDGLAQVDLPADVSATSGVTSSPLGFSLVVVSEARGLVQMFSSLPNNPTLALSTSFSDLGGAPTVVGVSDDGTTLLFSTRSGERDSLYAIQNGGQPQIIYSGDSISSATFAPNSKDAVLTDTVRNQVYLLRNSTGFFGPSLLADEGAGISRPVTAQFSRDGQQVVVANSQSRTVQSFALDGTLRSSTPCGDEPRLLIRMIGNAVFRLTDFATASIAVFDGDSDPAATFLIGPSSQGDSSVPEGLPLARATAARK